VGTVAVFVTNVWERGGNGGAGIVSSITGSPIQYGGGGGGGTYAAGSYVSVLGVGCAGGGNGFGLSNGDRGTTGGNSVQAANGLANTGGGGGGGGGPGSNTSGAGGSGIVVIRYLAAQGFPQSTVGSPRTYVAGPYRVYIWTTSGSITF
jgi:hypothetical protein